uniref:SET domain-containing protein n=1 Tax=Rhabditophanes sp. KR3021 TaxID=114890 RepID=A0AC35TZV3_9BILA
MQSTLYISPNPGFMKDLAGRSLDDRRHSAPRRIDPNATIQIHCFPKRQRIGNETASRDGENRRSSLTSLIGSGKGLRTKMKPFTFDVPTPRTITSNLKRKGIQLRFTPSRKERILTESDCGGKTLIRTRKVGSDGPAFTVDDIIAKDKGQYLVKWKNYNFIESTIEPRSNLINCEERLKKFEEKSKVLEDIYRSLRKKPTNYVKFPNNAAQKAMFKSIYETELLMERTIKKSQLFYKTPVYIANWNDFEVIPLFHYITANRIHQDICMDFKKNLEVEHCTNCVATKPTDYCGGMKKHFEGNDIDYTVKNVCMECSDKCKCLLNPCPTIVADKGKRVPLVIYKTHDKGWGLLSGGHIQKGELVCEYVGEVIDEETAIKRELNGNNYIFGMDYISGDKKTTKYHIDASTYCNESRFANHACDPNSEIKAIFSKHQNDEYHRVAFFAKRDIFIGEEITINYYDCELPKKGKTLSYIKCECNSKMCIKSIPMNISKNNNKRRN